MKKFFPLLLISLIFLSCAGTQITSTADKSYSKKLSKIFILAELPTSGWVGTVLVKNETEIAQDNYETFKTTFENKFQEIGVKCECEVITGLELDDSIYSQKIKDFSPDAILMIDLISVTTQEKTMIGSEYNLSFIDFSTNKRFWRANLKLSNLVMGLRVATGENIANTMFDGILNQLEKDKIKIF